MNILELKRQARELSEQTKLKLKQVSEGTISQKSFTEYMNGPSGAIARDADITAQMKAYNAAAGLGDPSGGPRRESMRRKGIDVAPIAFDDVQLKAMHQAVGQRTSLQIRTKAFSTVDSLLPAQLSPAIVGPQYEGRLFDRLQAEVTSAPSWEFIRHTSTTGAPAITAEGATKPELVFNTDKVIVTPQKLAAHTGISWESLEDFDSFQQYVTQELMRQVVAVENNELLNGDGTTGHLSGLLNTSGILTHAVGTDTALDAVEISIAVLRTGAALAEANLLVLHPTTWSALRRSKDSQGRYLVDPDPTNAAGNQLWGCEVLPTTQVAAGVGALLDTNKLGYTIVRESLSLKTGTANDDVTRNIVRFIAEERLALAVQRPAAVCKITGLPTA